MVTYLTPIWNLGVGDVAAWNIVAHVTTLVCILLLTPSISGDEGQALGDSYMSFHFQPDLSPWLSNAGVSLYQKITFFFTKPPNLSWFEIPLYRFAFMYGYLAWHISGVDF